MVFTLKISGLLVVLVETSPENDVKGDKSKVEVKRELKSFFVIFFISLIKRKSIVKVPITEPIKPPKKLIKNPDCLNIISSFFSSSTVGESTTFKR